MNNVRNARARALEITEKPLSHTYMIHECELFSGRHHTHFYAFTYVCACVGWRARLCTLFTDFSTVIAAAYTSRDFFFFAFPPSHYFQVTRVLGLEKYSFQSRMLPTRLKSIHNNMLDYIIIRKIPPCMYVCMYKLQQCVTYVHIDWLYVHTVRVLTRNISIFIQYFSRSISTGV